MCAWNGAWECRYSYYVVLRFDLHFFFFLQNELYIFMEYCSEGTLWTAAQQGLTDYMIRHYTREILKAVDALHDRGVVHRDIKGKQFKQFVGSSNKILLNV